MACLNEERVEPEVMVMIHDRLPQKLFGYISTLFINAWVIHYFRLDYNRLNRLRRANDKSSTFIDGAMSHNADVL